MILQADSHDVSLVKNIIAWSDVAVKSMHAWYSKLHKLWVLGRVNIGSHWHPYEMIYDGQWYPGIDGA